MDLNNTLKDILDKPQEDKPVFLGLVISMINDHTSTVATRKVVKSIQDTKSDIMPFVMPATTPATLNQDLLQFGKTLEDWTYPKSPAEKRLDLKSGLTLTGYNAKDYTKVVSCMVSHMKAWFVAAMVGDGRPVVVLEHDAIFTRRFKASDFPSQSGGIIGLNDPRGATRKSAVYYDVVINSTGDLAYPHIKPAPMVDDENVPQGLAGNSAYIIYPRAARHMLELVSKYGLWPNDALMCNQLVPYLKHTYPFYTTLQGVQSTTQG